MKMKQVILNLLEFRSLHTLNDVEFSVISSGVMSSPLRTSDPAKPPFLQGSIIRSSNIRDVVFSTWACEAPNQHTSLTLDAQLSIPIPHPNRHLMMAPKRTASSQSTTTQTQPAPSTPISLSKPKASTGGKKSAAEIAHDVWKSYLDTTPQRTKLIDVFMVFLMVVGGLQFLYCVIAGNFVRSHAYTLKI